MFPLGTILFLCLIKAFMYMKKNNPVVVKRTPADFNHDVVTVTGGNGAHRKTPCADCPWKKSAVGEFPAEAFRISAHTSYDMDKHHFSCHSSKLTAPKICAGFLLRGADHNLAVRMGILDGIIDLSQVSDGGHELFDSYKEMAIANGVSPDDECLVLSRDD